MTTCAGCGQEIVWVVTKTGKRMPLDPAVLSVVTEAGEVVRGRQSHFASCPRAKDFRKVPG